MKIKSLTYYYALCQIGEDVLRDNREVSENILKAQIVGVGSLV